MFCVPGLVAFALSLAFSSVIGLHITVQPHVFHTNDKNVSLICSYGNKTETLIHQVTKLRVERFDKEGVWTDVAVLNHDGSIDVSDSAIVATGLLGHVFGSHLKVTWPVASSDIYSKYRCDSVGYTAMRDIVVDESTELDVPGMSTELFQIYRIVQESDKKGLETFKKIMFHVSELKSSFQELKSQFCNVTPVPQVKTDIEKVQWPQGSFVLLMPDTGCPANPPAWDKGFITAREDDHDKHYPANIPKHLASPYYSSGLVYQHYCSLLESPERQQPWPAGTYCINARESIPCPGGFNYTVVRIDYKSNVIYNYGRGIRPGHYWSSYYGYKDFCCRHDGSPDTPISLPVSDPFYLYRHKGKCQSIQGMNMTQDVFMMTTTKDDGGSLWISGDAENGPDVTFDPLHEELCYYSKR